MSLILPAVQKVRDSAKRTQCQNQLKQIGIAIAHYEAMHSTLPPAIKNPLETPQGTLPNQGYNVLDVDGPHFAAGRTGTISAGRCAEDRHIGADCTGTLGAMTRTGTLRRIRHWKDPVPLWICPSDTRLHVSKHPLAGFRLAIFSYVAVGGIRSDNKGDKTGMIYGRSRVKMSDVRDGTSNTVMIGERPGHRRIRVERMVRLDGIRSIHGRRRGAGHS